MKKVILMVSMLLVPRLLAAQEIDLNALEGEQWYGLYMLGQKSGYGFEKLEVKDDKSVELTEDLHLTIKMMGRRQSMRLQSKRLYGPDGALKHVESFVDDESGQSQYIGDVAGDTMLLRTVVGGAETKRELDKPTDSLKDVLAKFRMFLSESAQVGHSTTFSLFEPLYAIEIHCESRITGVEERVLDGTPTKVFAIRTTMKELGVTTVSYITEDGTTLEDITSGMITMRLEPKELAQQVDFSNDVIVSNAAMVEKSVANPRTRDELHLRVRGPLRVDHLYNDERQTLKADGDAFLFAGRRISLEGFEAATLPIPADSAVAEWLKPTQFVQSDHPKLIEQAKQIAGNETDSWKVSEKLCHWVNQNMTTTFSARLSNALEVLQSKEGDCTEHSILFVGLARAAGIPAREVAGLIYMENPGGEGGGFYFHQWAKVWVGKWVDVDPTWDQPLADATHVKLSEGDLVEQMRLLPIIGQIHIEVLNETQGS